MAAGLDASDEQVRALAAEILAREPYAVFRSDAEPWREVLRQLAGWLDWLERARVTSPGLYWMLVFALLAVVAGLLVHMVWTVSVALRMPAPEFESGALVPESGLLERAEAFAREGRFLEAARQLQLATLELLLRGRLIELSRSEPNRVLRRRLQQAPLPEAERRELLGLLDRLEARWFRDRLEEPGLYESWRQLHSRVAALAGLS